MRSRIFGTFVVKCLACAASPKIFEHLKMVKFPIYNGFLPEKGHLGRLSWAEIFEKVSFDNLEFSDQFSARKSEQLKVNF